MCGETPGCSRPPFVRQPTPKGMWGPSATPRKCAAGLRMFLRVGKLQHDALMQGEAFSEPICDCHRLYPADTSNCCDRATENRVFQGPDFSVSYFQWFGHLFQPHGTFPPEFLSQAMLGNRTSPPTCPVGYAPLEQAGQGNRSSIRWHWSLPADEFLSRVVRQGRPTHIIVAIGLWNTSKLSRDFFRRLGKAGKTAVADSHGHVLWRITPRPKVSTLKLSAFHSASNPDPSILLDAGWEVHDAAAIVSGLQKQRSESDDAVFPDGVHVSPEYNDLTAIRLLTHLMQDKCPGIHDFYPSWLKPHRPAHKSG